MIKNYFICRFMTELSNNIAPDELKVEIRGGNGSVGSRFRSVSASKKIPPEASPVSLPTGEDEESKIHCVDYLRVKDLTQVSRLLYQNHSANICEVPLDLFFFTCNTPQVCFKFVNSSTSSS